MQIVADADEGEALLQEFADARSSKQEQAQDDVVLLGRGAEFVGGGLQLRRKVHVRKLVFLKQAHRHAEIVLAEKQQVDARDGRDFVDVLDAVGGLHLQRDDDVVVG